MKLSERGQITIPKAIRERFQFKPDEELCFEEFQGKLLLTRMPAKRTSGLRKWVGALNGMPDDVDCFVDEIRGA